MSEPKLLRYNHLHRVMECRDERGFPVPFNMKYICMDGEVMEVKNVVCTSVDVRHKKRNIKFLDSGQVRTIHDALVLEVNGFKILVG